MIFLSFSLEYLAVLCKYQHSENGTGITVLWRDILCTCYFPTILLNFGYPNAYHENKTAFMRKIFCFD